MVKILFLYDHPQPQTYGHIFSLVGELLKKQDHTVSHLNLDTFIATYDFSHSYLEETSASLDPDLVISHQTSLRRSLLQRRIPPVHVRVLEEEIDQFFIPRYWGRIQTNSPHYCADSLEFKEGFIRRMRQDGLPVPPTILRDDVDPEQWTYTSLSQALNSPNLVFKDIRSTGGRGIYFLSHEDPIIQTPTIRIVQSKIKSRLPYASSLRVVTFPNQILSVSIHANPSSGTASNLAQGGQRLRIGESVKYPPSLDKLLRQNGVTPHHTLAPQLQEIILTLSALPSQSLLRGIDVIGDSEGNIYLLEAQTLPGNPLGASDIFGIGPPATVEEKIKRIAQVLGTHLTTNVANDQNEYKRTSPISFPCANELL